MMSLVDRRRNWKLRKVKPWPRQQVKQGHSLDVEADVSEGFFPAEGP